MTGERNDVFMSLAGPDRTEVRQLVSALRAAGLRVFLDEHDIRQYSGITEQIEGALRGSKTLLAYYSRHFTSRTACQYELTSAFLAGQREGDPTRRIMVINPHEDTDHLLPVELAEDKFERLPAPQDVASMSHVVQRVAAKVAAVDGCIGGVRFADRPRWYVRRVPGAFEFVGRYRELWTVHSALRKHEFGLTQNASMGPVAVLVGMRGIGKSELAAAYAWHFGAAHLGGVYWIGLTGCPPDRDQISARFIDEVRTLLQLADLDVAGLSSNQVIGRFADHVASKAEPSLLVIDDVPDGRLVDELMVPAGNRLHTLLISDRTALDGPARPIRVGPMSLTDSLGVLRQYRDGSDAEVSALAQRLDGHPMALRLAGRHLRDLNDLLSYADFLERIEHDGSALRPVTALLRDRIADLDGPPRRALYLSIVCSPAALPAKLLERALGRPDAEAAVAGLRDHLVATRLGTAWQIHALVRDTAREYLPAPDGMSLAHDAATAVLTLTDLDPAGESLLFQHAGHLAARTDLPPDLRDSLLQRVVQHYDDRGEPILALPHHARLAQLHPDDPAILLDLARSLHLTGSSNEANQYAAQALTLADDPALRHRCQQLRAEAMDTLGTFADADQIWNELRTDPGAGGIEMELAYLRGLRLRGGHTEARRELGAMITRLESEPSRFHQTQFAHLELARAEMETDGQFVARRRALMVMSVYNDHKLSRHSNAVEAGRIFADARLTLSLWELRTERAVWREAADDLRELRDSYTRTHGPRNMLTLNVAVAHAEALIALGKPNGARQVIEGILDDLRDRLGQQHPVSLRAYVVLGYGAAQSGRYHDARKHFSLAYEGQRSLLGPTHPHTLRSQLALGIALKMTGNSAIAAKQIAQVRRSAPESVGRNTDLYGQATVAWLLRPLPNVVWRWLANKPKRPE